MICLFSLPFSPVAGAKVAITATMGVVGDRVLALKTNVDKVLAELDKDNANTVSHVLVATGDDSDGASSDSGRDIHLEKVLKVVKDLHADYPTSLCTLGY